METIAKVLSVSDKGSAVGSYDAKEQQSVSSADGFSWQIFQNEMSNDTYLANP
jgi:hypothetical protein